MTVFYKEVAAGQSRLLLGPRQHCHQNIFLQYKKKNVTKIFTSKKNFQHIHFLMSRISGIIVNSELFCLRLLTNFMKHFHLGCTIFLLPTKALKPFEILT